MANLRASHLLPLLLAGCSSGVSLDDFPAKSAASYCARVYACCKSGELDPKSNLYPDQPTCASKLKQQFEGKRGQIKSGIDKGRVTFNGDKLSDCLDNYAQASCDALKNNATSDFPPCSAWLEPKVMPGGPCTQNEECIGGACMGVMPNMDGTCKAFVAESASCADAPCGKGLYCDAGAKVCKKTHPDNDPCNLNLECSTGGCNGKDQDAGTPGTCGLKGGPNSMCFVTIGCAVGGSGRPGMLVVFGLLVAALAIRRRRTR